MGPVLLSEHMLRWREKLETPVESDVLSRASIDFLLNFEERGRLID